jgi:hypothetical protein
MKSLLIPVAGRSSRYPGMRPKWMLTMPDGRLMIEQSVEQLDLESFDRIIVICLREHVERHSTAARLTEILRAGISPKAELLQLEAPTGSQVETIALALLETKLEGAFLVKDCDNTFALRYEGNNEVAVADLHAMEKVNAGNKSYVQTDPLGVVTNIVEKHVISNLFCCGAYGFASVSAFLDCWNQIKNQPDLYLSHVIFKMMLEGTEFKARQVSGYVDWGTLKDHRDFCDRFITLFCDVDGVLMENSSKFAADPWSYVPLQKNIDSLRRIQASGRLYLVVSTSRPESSKAELDAKLKALGLHVDQYVMGLPHTSRVLLNDYSSTNPYPSATAINLERDSDRLDALLARTLMHHE